MLLHVSMLTGVGTLLCCVLLSSDGVIRVTSERQA